MKSSTFETILPHYYCFSEENTFNSVTYLGGGTTTRQYKSYKIQIKLCVV